MRLRRIGELNVSCDMKLQLVLLGWSNPDQALRVSAGTPRKHASDGLSRSRGYCQRSEALPGNVANLAASRPGDALESENTVKLLNARKHRESEPSHTRLFKAGAKRAGSRVRVV